MAYGRCYLVEIRLTLFFLPQVKIIVDGNEFRKRFVSDVDLINPNFVYLAGSNWTLDLTNFHISRNFEGIIDKVCVEATF